MADKPVEIKKKKQLNWRGKRKKRIKNAKKPQQRFKRGRR